MSLDPLKALARLAMPAGSQVPMRYAYQKLRGRLEPEMALLREHVRAGNRVVDVGGNRGIYAYHCWRLGAAVEVFEPNPTCLRDLAAWAKDKPSVLVHPVALSDHDGFADLAIPVDEAGVEHDASASIEHGALNKVRIERVALRTLDSFGFDQVELIKIDVEGHEASVIAGARETIARCRPVLLVEIEKRHLKAPIADVFAAIGSLGYRAHFLRNGKLLPIQAFDPDRDQNLANFGSGAGDYVNNFLFVPDSAC